MHVHNNAERKRCRCCGTLLYLCVECRKVWFAPTKKGQRICGNACRTAKLRAKAMVTTKDGKKLHLLGEVKDGEKVLVAVKYYDKSKRLWVHELKPKEELQ